MDVHKMLEQVKAGQLDIAEAEAKLKDLPYEGSGLCKAGPSQETQVRFR